MRIITVTKRFNFCASHRLFNTNLTSEENKELFEDCNKLHGHNFTLEVSIEGDINPVSGMVINFHDLKKIVNENVVLYLDHSNFETDIPELAGKVQTAENLIGFIWDRIEKALEKSLKLVNLKLYETNDSWVELKQ